MGQIAVREASDEIVSARLVNLSRDGIPHGGRRAHDHPPCIALQDVVKRSWRARIKLLPKPAVLLVPPLVADRPLRACDFVSLRDINVPCDADLGRSL